ncbi:hypothetical protein CHELA17_64003 [Chelatococcus asaccharovorans]|nr:hypothetical protein CHELA17_64003 [Chelatococcus asaccharovorans]
MNSPAFATFVSLAMCVLAMCVFARRDFAMRDFAMPLTMVTRSQDPLAVTPYARRLDQKPSGRQMNRART